MLAAQSCDQEMPSLVTKMVLSVFLQRLLRLFIPLLMVGREVIEDIVKEELTKNPGPPGKFYPFMSGKIKVDSPLGQLLATKGITPENSNQFEGTADW